MVETATRRRKDVDNKAAAGGGSADKKAGAEGGLAGRGKGDDRKAFRGRYNPKLSDKESVVSHSMLGKLLWKITEKVRKATKVTRQTL